MMSRVLAVRTAGFAFPFFRSTFLSHFLASTGSLAAPHKWAAPQKLASSRFSSSAAPPSAPPSQHQPHHQHKPAPPANPSAPPPRVIPVTILTGFLGAGKTTLLNNILSQDHGLKIAVIENEFGEVGIDHLLVSKRFTSPDGDDIFLMNNGCVCCTVRTDLFQMLGEIFKMSQEKQIDAILIETTGLADPGPVALTFFEEEIRKYARLDAILTVVDAKHCLKHLRQPLSAEGFVNEAVQQVAHADRIIINKTDLVTPAELAVVLKEIRAINPSAGLTKTTQSKVPVQELLGLGGFDLDRILKTVNPRFLEPLEQEQEALIRQKQAELEHDHSCSHDHVHDESCRHDHDHHHHDANCGHNHDHGDSCSDPSHSHQSPSHQQHYGHKHDSSVTSVGVESERALDQAKVAQWVQALLTAEGDNLYRMKGVLHIAGQPRRLVCQAVHDTWCADWLDVWGRDEKRMNKMVFIGKNLDRAQLLTSFHACEADQ